MTDQTIDQTATANVQTGGNVQPDAKPADAPKTPAQTGAKGNRKSRRAAQSKSKGTGANKAAAAKSKGKGKSKADAPKRQYDGFGFVQGSKRSQVAALYARPHGATRADINAAVVGDPSADKVPTLNLLTDAQSRGHKVGKLTVVDKATGRRMTAYRLTHADKAPSDGTAPVPNRKAAGDAKAAPKATAKGKTAGKAAKAA